MILVNRRVANKLATFGHGEGCFLKPSERSEFFMWELVLRHSCHIRCITCWVKEKNYFWGCNFAEEYFAHCSHISACAVLVVVVVVVIGRNTVICTV